MYLPSRKIDFYNLSKSHSKMHCVIGIIHVVYDKEVIDLPCIN